MPAIASITSSTRASRESVLDPHAPAVLTLLGIVVELLFGFHGARILFGLCSRWRSHRIAGTGDWPRDRAPHLDDLCGGRTLWSSRRA
jgi:hypothetical protein